MDQIANWLHLDVGLRGDLLLSSQYSSILLEFCMLNNLQDILLNKKSGTSLVVQWLRLRAPNAGGLGSIPGQGTRSRMPQLKDLACHN